MIRDVTQAHAIYKMFKAQYGLKVGLLYDIQSVHLTKPCDVSPEKYNTSRLMQTSWKVGQVKKYFGAFGGKSSYPLREAAKDTKG